MRLMSWNINRFNVATLNRNMPFNQWYIVETVYTQALDIFIVIETQSAQGLRGSLIQGNGRAGVLELLALLRAETGAPDWRLVPPLKLVHGIIGQNYTEGIAVFYNNTTLDFQGPYYWDDNQNIATLANPGIGSQYPAAWNGAFPGTNNRAGKVNFTHYQNGTALEFPNAADRRPFYTVFQERGGLARNIKLFSVHFPPHQGPAAQALNQLSLADEVRNNIGANDVVIVAGDYNFNLINLGQNHVDDVRFFSLANLFLPIQFNIAAGSTRIDTINNATPQGAPPGYGYALAQYLDNIFVRYGGGLVAPAHNPLVINRVVGTGPYGVDMAVSIPNIQAMAHLTVPQQNDLFRDEDNYGHIAAFGGVSDHLPLVMDI